MLNKGDEINVRVVEVDRERGRIGVRLLRRPGDRRQVRRGTDDAVGSGGGGGGGDRGDVVRARRRDGGGGRNGGSRGSGRPRHRDS